MPSYRVRHPRNLERYALYGYEPINLAFFAHIFEGGACVGRYDALQEGYDCRRPLIGAIRFLSTYSFFSFDDFDEVLALMPYQLPREMPSRLRRAARVVANFQSAAD